MARHEKLVRQNIPRRIIQTGKSAELPLLDKAAVVNLRLLNPNFEYLFFDDSQVEEFMGTEFPQHLDVFNGFHSRIQRYDFFRYLAVYRFGGFYFDTDVFLASSLDNLLQCGCVFPFEELTLQGFLRSEYGMDWEIGNYAFGAAAGDPFLNAIIQNCVRAQQQPEWAEAMMSSIPRMFRKDFFVLNTTGPGLISRTLAEYSGACGHVRVLFPEDVCDPSSWHCFGSYGVHLQSGSWRRRSGFLRRRLQGLWETTRRKALLRESIQRGAKRSLQFDRPV